MSSFLKKLRRKNQESSPSHDPNEASVPEEDTGSDAPQGQGYQPPTTMVLQHYTAEQSPAGSPPPPAVAPLPGGAPALFAGLQLAPPTTIVVPSPEQSHGNLLGNGQTSGIEANGDTPLSEGGSAFSFLGSGSDSRAEVVTEEREEESKTQGSVFSFMNLAQASESQIVLEENDAPETSGKEEISMAKQSAFSFLQGPHDDQKAQGDSAPGDLNIEAGTASSGGVSGEDPPSLGEAMGSAFSFLHPGASEDKPDQSVSLLQSLGPATPSGSDTSARGQESVPTLEQPHVTGNPTPTPASLTTPTTAPVATPPKSTGPGAVLRNFLGFGRGSKKQSPVPVELPPHTNPSPWNPPSTTTTTSTQGTAELTTPPAKDDTAELPRERARDEVPRPTHQEAVEQQRQVDATPLPASLSALLHQGEGVPSAPPTLAFAPKKWALPPAKGTPTLSVSTPTIATEISGKASPSPPQQPPPATKVGTATPTTKAAPARQLPPSGKKKKRKALRPGQGREDEDTASLEGGSKDADTHSLESESSATDGKAAGDALDEMLSEGVGLQQLVEVVPVAKEVVPVAKELVPVAKEVVPVAKELVQVAPPVSKVATSDAESKDLESECRGEEPNMRSKKDSIPSGLRAAFQLDRVTTHPASESRDEGEEPDHPAVPRGEHVHAQGSSEVHVVPKDARNSGKAVATGNKAALSGAEKLSIAMRNSESDLAKVRSDQKSVQQKYTEVLDGHLAATKKQIETRLHLEDLKAKETKALADENYELADELSRELESAGHSQEWVTASACQTAMKEWVESWSKLIATEVSLQRTLEANLSVIKEEQSKVLAGLEKEFSHQFSRDKVKLKTLEDKVERERGHVALDREHLEKSEALLKEDLDSQCSNFIATKQKLQTQREEVLEEIATMEAKLRALRDKERSIAVAIEAEQDKIEAIRRELSGEQAHLAEQRAELSKKEAELKKEEVVLRQMKEAYEASTEKKEAEKRGVLASIQTIEAIASEGGARTIGLQAFLEESGSLVRGDTSAILKPSPQLQSLQDKYQARERAAKDAAAQVFQLQSGISSLKNKVTDTERQLPALEEAKKAAVNARQFKEAARLSAEIKQLGADIEEYKGSLSEKEKQLCAKKREHESSEQGIASIKAELDVLQREEDLRHIRDLVKISDSLKSRTEKISSSPSLLCVLQYWSLLHELLAQDLCAKHNLNISDFKGTDDAAEVGKVSTLPVVSPDLTPQSGTTDVCDAKAPHTGVKSEEGSPNELSGDNDSAAVKALNDKIGEVEAQIAQACEAENYELAAQLEEQLQELKKPLVNS